MPDPTLPVLPTLKRPRSSSNPPSPTGSSSSKKAASEDTNGSPVPALEGSVRLEVSPLANSTLVEESMTGIEDHAGEAVGKDAARTDVDGDGGEWVKMTEDVHLDGGSKGEGADGGERAKRLGKEKYVELYNELLGSSPPPFNAFERYYIIPAKFRDDLKAAAFSDEAESASSAVKLDITPLLADLEGEEVYVIDNQKDSDGTTSLAPKGTKERIWSLKMGLQEDEDFVYISTSGWKTLATALGAESGPSLSRFAISGNRIQLTLPIYTLYQVQAPGGPAPIPTATPIRFTCPTETLIPIFVRLLRSLVAEAATVDKSAAYRVWAFETLMAFENNDPAAKAALNSSHIAPVLIPGLAGKMVASSGETDSAETCASRNFEDGDSFILEFGKKLGGDQTDWVMDVSMKGEAVVKPTISMPPVPTAPPPLFSQPAKFPGTAPSTATAGESSSTGMFGMTTRAQTKKVAKTRGLVGLVNLGNTCFMNSATQCLSNTVELCDYFLSGVYREELNRDNPLGMHGQVAEAFGGVVESLWSPNPSSSFSPRQLKGTTSRFAPQFAGYGQHDTQEFIAFLLDGLHEDLNRIQKKPYVEKPDWKAGGGNKELAELGKECWGGYKKRNDSVIVDLFQGQLMSTLVCPECHKESITMDPFMYLTVPLPIAQHREFKYEYLSRDPEKPIVKGKLLVPANVSFSQVKEKLSVLMKCNPNHLLGFDLWKNGIYAWFNDSDHNGEAKDHDVPVFQDVGVPTSTTRKSTGILPTDGSITVPVFTFRIQEGYRGRAGDIPDQGDIMPFFITLSRAEAADASAVREAIAKGYARFIEEEAYAGMWVPSGSKHAGVPSVQEEGEGASNGVAAGPDDHVNGNGDETKVAEIPIPSEGSELGSRPASPLNEIHTTLIRNNASSASLSTLASVKSGKIVPRGDLYKVHVADASTGEGGSSLGLFKSKDTVVPVYKGGSPRQASNSWSLLEARRKAKKNLLGRFTSGISSIVGGSSGEDAEASAANGTKEKEKEKEGASSALVVRPGEAIFCEWSIPAYQEYLQGGLRPEEEFVDPAIEKERAKKKEGKSISIEDCLDEFSKQETLGADDLWFCPVCKKHQAATKRLEIYKAPDILVICIKRFGSSRRLSDKLDNLVNFPIEGLDLEERIGERKIAKEMKLSAAEAKEFGMEGDDEESWVYDLYGVDNHFGGLGGGHYTAFCKNKEDGEWYNYDDSRVSPASVSGIQTRAAYLLFYRRRTVRPIGGISRIKAEEALSRNPSRAVSPAPSSPVMAPAPHPFPSNLRSSFEPAQSSSSPADSRGSSSPMTSDDGRLPSYSQRGTHSPPTSFNRSGDNTTLHLNVDSSDEELQTNKKFTTQNFVTSGMPYGETQWGVSSSQAGPARFSFGTDLNSSLPSPPASDDGMNYDNLRAATQAQFRGPVAEHPATEALAAADVTDTVSEVDSLEVMMGKKSEEKVESGLGEEYGVIAAEKENEGMQVDGTEVDAGEDLSAGGEKKE